MIWSRGGSEAGVDEGGGAPCPLLRRRRSSMTSSEERWPGWAGAGRCAAGCGEAAGARDSARWFLPRRGRQLMKGPLPRPLPLAGAPPPPPLLPLAPPPSSSPPPLPSLMMMVFISQLSEASASLSSRMLKGASCSPLLPESCRGLGGRGWPTRWVADSFPAGVSNDTLAGFSVLGKATQRRMPRTSATRAVTPTLRWRWRISLRPSTSTRRDPRGLTSTSSFSQSPPPPHAGPSIVASVNGTWPVGRSGAAVHPPSPAPPLVTHDMGEP